MKFKKRNLQSQEPAKDSDIVVGSGKAKHHLPKSLSPKKLGIVVGVVIFVVGTFLVIRNQTNNSAYKSACDSLTVEQGITLVNVYNAQTGQSTEEKLTKINESVDRIKGLNEYEKDPNCTHLLLEFNVALGNSAESRKYLELTKAQKDAKRHEQLRPLAALEQEVKYLEELAKEAEASIIFLPGGSDAPGQ